MKNLKQSLVWTHLKDQHLLCCIHVPLEHQIRFQSDNIKHLSLQELTTKEDPNFQDSGVAMEEVQVAELYKNIFLQ